MISRVVVLNVAFLAGLINAQVQNLRITEVDPFADRVEVTNFGPAFVTAAVHPFCHRFNYTSSIPAGTSFAAGEIRTFTVTGLADADSDLWLYSVATFTVGANIVHGLKWGPAANVGRASLAASVGRWPSGTAFIPAPSAGQTLAFDGFGFAPSDWFRDATPSMGSADPIASGSVTGGLGVPAGTATFENLGLGAEVQTLVGWPVVDTGTTAGDFDLRIIGDVSGQATPLASPGSTRWLRIRDQDSTSAQNRFYSDFLSTGRSPSSYEMRLALLPLELPAASAANRPRLTVQHLSITGVENLFGFELDQSGIRLIVLSAGGPPASATLGTLSTSAWADLRLTVDFSASTITGRAGAAQATLPIALAAGVDPTNLRFCFRGEGLGNVSTLLLDDLSFAFTFPFAGSATCRPVSGGTEIDLGVSGGVPGNIFQHLVAVQRTGRAPNGPIFGLDVTLSELQGQLFRAPFFGTLNANGSALFVIPLPGVPCPLGIQIDRVTLEFSAATGAILRTDTPSTVML